MKFGAVPVQAEELIGLKERYRAEAGCQIVNDSALFRGFTDPYQLQIDGQPVGYGLVWHRFYEGRAGELYLEPHARPHGRALLAELIRAGQPTHLMVQTNIPLLVSLAWDFVESLVPDRVVFSDGGPREITPPLPGLEFVEVPNPTPNHPDSRDYALKLRGETVAAGGYLCHYNPPYCDVHMEVAESHRGRGIGRYYVSQVMAAARANGKIPAARCDLANHASRATLEGAGFVTCGHLAEGVVKRAAP